jgi:hypothetical protein
MKACRCSWCSPAAATFRHASTHIVYLSLFVASRALGACITHSIGNLRAHTLLLEMLREPSEWVARVSAEALSDGYIKSERQRRS